MSHAAAMTGRRRTPPYPKLGSPGSVPLGERAMGSGAVLSVADLDVSAPPFQTYDPFLFCVYHRDEYPAGDGSMQAPRRGNGNDFDRDAPYRMYHGDRIPGYTTSRFAGEHRQ